MFGESLVGPIGIAPRSNSIVLVVLAGEIANDFVPLIWSYCKGFWCWNMLDKVLSRSTKLPKFSFHRFCKRKTKILAKNCVRILFLHIDHLPATMYFSIYKQRIGTIFDSLLRNNDHQPSPECDRNSKCPTRAQKYFLSFKYSSFSISKAWNYFSGAKMGGRESTDKKNDAHKLTIN